MNESSDSTMIRGVYCDLAGTLTMDDFETINQNILEVLKEEESKGRDIFLWTGGDPNQAQKKLEKHNIKWKVLSKRTFRDKTVETVIDDLNIELFSTLYEINCIEYVQLVYCENPK